MNGDPIVDGSELAAEAGLRFAYDDTPAFARGAPAKAFALEPSGKPVTSQAEETCIAGLVL